MIAKVFVNVTTAIVVLLLLVCVWGLIITW
jgi:hypothetical protein